MLTWTVTNMTSGSIKLSLNSDSNAFMPENNAPEHMQGKKISITKFTSKKVWLSSIEYKQHSMNMQDLRKYCSHIRPSRETRLETRMLGEWERKWERVSWIRENTGEMTLGREETSFPIATRAISSDPSWIVKN